MDILNSCCPLLDAFQPGARDSLAIMATFPVQGAELGRQGFHNAWRDGLRRHVVEELLSARSWGQLSKHF
jgi:hypothetical protein